MPELRAFGLKSIKLGVVETFASPAILGVTYKDTATLSQADDEVVEIMSEENADPEEILSTPGRKSLNWSIIDVAPDTAVQVLGGTVTTVDLKDTWNAPAAGTTIEKSVIIETQNGIIIKIARAKITAKINFEFRKLGVLRIDITAVPLTPATEGLSSISITEPAA